MSEPALDVDHLRRELAQLQARADWAERRLGATHTVSRIVAEETSIATAMPRVLAAIGAMLDAKLGALWIPGGATLEVTSLWTAAHHEASVWEQLCRRHRLGPGTGLPGRAWRERRPIWLQELRADGNIPRVDGLARLRIASGLAFPITIGTEVVGVIEHFSEHGEPPDDGMLDLLRTIGGQLGQFFQQLRNHDELRRQVEQQKHMARASQVFSSSLDVDQVLAELAKVTCPWLGDWCVLHERDGGSATGGSASADGFRIATTHCADAALGERVASVVQAFGPALTRGRDVQTAVTNGQPVVVERFADVVDVVANHAAADPSQQELLRGLAIHSYVVAPLIAPGGELGAISVFRCGATRPFTDEDVTFVQELANRAALAVSNARMFGETRTAARDLAVERETLKSINEIVRRIAAKLDPDELARAITDAIIELTDAQVAAYYEVDDAGRATTLLAAAGATADKLASWSPIVDTHGPILIDDLTRDPRHGRRRRGEHEPAIRGYLAVPVIGRAGTMIGVICGGHERAGAFTERAQRLAEAVAAHAAVAMDNAQLYSEAQRLISELEKTNGELDQFAYVASHDLRAPLRGIANLALWIEEDLGPDAPPKVLEQLRLLKGRTARMDKLMNALLELARVGRARQRAERVDVTELLHETIDLLSPAPATRVLIIGSMPTLVAERTALQQTFLNLIANALQHSERPDVVVRITASEREHEVEFAIADNGVGIAPEHHERVWQLFQTLGARDAVENTGIGLTIVRKQCEAHGGRAWIDPAVREGTTVRFTWAKLGK